MVEAVPGFTDVLPQPAYMGRAHQTAGNYVLQLECIAFIIAQISLAGAITARSWTAKQSMTSRLLSVQ